MRGKAEERREARLLREQGMPMKQIAAALAVSPASVHLWTRDIELSDDQRRLNLKRAGAERGRAWAERHRLRRLEHQADGRARARLRDPLHLAGCMLYWAEGTKDKNSVRFCNSDAAMTRFFLHFLTTSMGVPLEVVTIRLNVYTNNGLTLDEIESYWLEQLGLPRSSLRKATINSPPTSSSGRRSGKLPYGVCTLIVNSTEVVQHIYGAIQEYSQVDDPAWLG